MTHIPVLMYHRVCKDGEIVDNDYVVDSNVFERQLQYFAGHGYHTPSLDEVFLARTTRSASAKRLLITFDDGYLDTFDTALPLLLKYGFTATVFIVTDFTRRNNWWDLPHTAEAKLMTADQVVQMKSLGIEIGSHGWSHRSLPMLNDEALTEELRRSKEDAERLLGKPVRYFAYPYGEVNDRVSAFARQAGYESAFATNQGPLSFYSDMFQIRRTLISNRADDAYLYVKLSGIEKACRRGWSILKKAIGKRPQYHPV